MKIYSIDFESMYPIPSGLIIAAKNKEEALKIAKDTVKHSEIESVNELDISSSGVIFYESGDY